MKFKISIKGYKLISIDWLDKDLVNYEMVGDKYFEENPNKKNVINDMVEFIFLIRTNQFTKKQIICAIEKKIYVYVIHMLKILEKFMIDKIIKKETNL